MTFERAAEILDPDHRECYDSIETVNEACRIGMDAILKQWPMKIVKNKYSKYICPKCLEIQNEPNKYCRNCGQALDWSSLDWPDDNCEYERLLNKVKKNKNTYNEDTETEKAWFDLTGNWPSS